MITQRFSVTGMSCAACSARVEKAVCPLPGVAWVQVNLLTHSMQVQYDEAQQTEAGRQRPRLGEGLVTGSLLFCVGTLSILGPVQSALHQDHTFLYTNAMLDLVTSMVLASTYGIGMCLAAGVLLVWQGSIYGLTVLCGDFISGTMMTELSIVGGFLIAMSGLAILDIKDCRTLNFLPALFVPVIWCLAAGRLF
jgi:uncharacterized membrane protein YqgA involved in biofilm formation